MLLGSCLDQQSRPRKQHRNQYNNRASKKQYQQIAQPPARLCFNLAAAFEADSKTKSFLNRSPHHINDPEFSETILEALGKHVINPQGMQILDLGALPMALTY